MEAKRFASSRKHVNTLGCSEKNLNSAGKHSDLPEVYANISGRKYAISLPDHDVFFCRTKCFNSNNENGVCDENGNCIVANTDKRRLFSPALFAALAGLAANANPGA